MDDINEIKHLSLRARGKGESHCSQKVGSHFTQSFRELELLTPQYLQYVE